MNVFAPERVIPPEMTPEERAVLGNAGRMLVAVLESSSAATITVDSEAGQLPAISIPPQALRAMATIFELMADGQAVTLIPEPREMTTTEAANFLRVSRPFVVKEIEAGRLPHRKVGTHRRVLFKDLVAYAATLQREREQALDDMVAAAEELGLYDE